MFKEITKDNWLLFAQQNYDNPTLEKEEEFYDDIKRFKYLKRLFRKYDITGEIKIRLILNHLIVLQNVLIGNVTSTIKSNCSGTSISSISNTNALRLYVILEFVLSQHI